MKLPEQYNLYKHNEYIDKLGSVMSMLELFYLPEVKPLISGICEANLMNLREMSAIITHLELAIDEVLKVPGVKDE